LRALRRTRPRPPAAPLAILLRASSSAPTAAASVSLPPSCAAHVNLLDPELNVPPALWRRVSRGLWRERSHPLGALAARIAGAFPDFTVHAELPPIVDAAAAFDELLTPAAHPSRSRSDTFYVSRERLLRCHMTAHQPALLRASVTAAAAARAPFAGARFLMVGDVFRRDEIDATHSPVFHQLDGVRVFSGGELAAAAGRDEAAQRAHVLTDLQRALDALAAALFGAAAPRRWVEATFPFTAPSLEMEVQWEGRWLEVLGCGEIRGEILARAGLPPDARGWAFGLGLERLAMVLHGIPDIRLFWSEDARFTSQFAAAAGAGAGAPPVRFKPYSRQPPCLKDVTFWLPPGFHDNDLADLLRAEAGDVVEAVARLDEFTHPKTRRTSRCYRITYRHMDRTLTNAEVDELQARVRARIVEKLGGELR